jgi:Bacterial archaeo-eukaryotic release factor family 10
MFTMRQLEPLSQLPSPLLTAYVRTSLVEASLHGSTPGYLPWLTDASRPIAESLSPTEQELFLKQLDRVEEFLRQRAPHEKSLVIFAGPSVWEIASLQREVQNELHWGKPALTQLLWLASEHKRYGIVVVDHAGARFFHYWLGELVEYEEKKFAIDISQWKKEELGHVTGQGVRKTRGSQREVFRKRMEGQYARVCRETAQQAVNFCTKKDLEAVFLVGLDRLIKPMETKFPRGFRQSIVLLKQDLARVTLLELQKHLEPQIAGWERRHEAELATAVTSDERGTVAGFDETLAHLQKGQIRTLVLARGLDGDLRQCVQCGWTDRSADPVCSVCGSERRKVTLRNVLPELARRYEVEIEVVSGEAAERLKKAEGMGAWLRQPKSVSARGGR